ncbi:hypothetical protein [Rivularia sp. UHCC 0363]
MTNAAIIAMVLVLVESFLTLYQNITV